MHHHRRFLYINHYADQYEILVEGFKIVRVCKLYSDSGIIRDVTFDSLSEALQDHVLAQLGNSSYEI